jgi:hypothetical protein
MNAVRILKIVDESLIAALPELGPLKGVRVQLVALPEEVEDLPLPPRRMATGSALGLLAGEVTIADGAERALLADARQEKFG